MRPLPTRQLPTLAIAALISVSLSGSAPAQPAPGCAWPASLDALAAAPGNHRLLFENEQVRVLDVVVAPKTKEPVHAHCWPSILYVTSGATFVDYDADGKLLFDSRTAPAAPFPVVEWLGPQAPHAVENLGDDPVHLVRVELKPSPAADAKEVAARQRERLEFLIGTWTVESMEDSFTETCEWYHQRSHVVCSSETVTAGGTRKGVSVFSYSTRKGRYVYYHYGSSGVANEMDVFIVDKSLLATYERQVGADLVREQVWMTPRADGTYDFREDDSTNGGPWTTVASVHYLRKAAAAR